MAQLPGLDVLGNSYDIFGEYANPKNVGHPLFDLGPSAIYDLDATHRYDKPRAVQVEQIRRDETYSVHGVNANAYHRKVNSQMQISGGILAFNASMESTFGSEVFKLTYSAYTTVTRLIQYYVMKLPPGDMRSYLKADVKNDIANMQPNALFDKYGTHFLASAVIGGRVSQHSRTDLTQYHSRDSISAAASTGFDLIVLKGGGKAAVKADSSEDRFYAASETEFIAIGGRPEFAAHITEPSDYERWANALYESPVFVDFEGPESLRPIWELCADADLNANRGGPVIPPEPYYYIRGRRIPNPNAPKVGGARAQQLYLAFIEYAKRKQKSFPSTDPWVVTDILVKDGENAQADPGYKLINVDLNLGAGGHYLYFEYRRDRLLSDDVVNRALTDADIVIGNDKNAGDELEAQGWRKNHTELNLGAGGKYIYLLTTDRPTGAPIEDITVGWSDDDSPPNKPGFRVIPKDLNKGAGGKYVWLYVRKLGDI